MKEMLLKTNFCIQVNLSSHQTSTSNIASVCKTGFKGTGSQDRMENILMDILSLDKNIFYSILKLYLFKILR